MKNDKAKMKTWCELNIKEKLAISTALAAFVLGWGLSVAGFIVPPVGEVADSLLWILGQALIYAASVFGITGYFTAESTKMKNDINKHIEHMERMQIQRENIRNNASIEEIPLETNEDNE